MKANFISLATALTLGASLVQAAPSAEKRDSNITPITVKGNAFFKGKDRFYMRGVDYQPGGSSKLYVLPSNSTQHSNNSAQNKRSSI